MKTTLLAFALVAVLISCAAAQDNDPQASLDPRGEAVHTKLPQAQTPPNFCQPCLFYAGDFDSNASDANGIPNEVDLIVSTGAAVYAPFIVPKGKTWTVTGVLTVSILGGDIVDPATIPYEVRKDIPKSGGNGGQLVCHGKKPAIVIDTGICQDFGLPCYAIIVGNIKGCRLPSGKYWLSLVPDCTNKNLCGDWRAFVMNDDGAMAHRYGPLEPANNSFFNSEYYGAVWEPSTEQQSSTRFDVGVRGTAK